MSAPGKKNGTWSTGVVKNDVESIKAEEREIAEDFQKRDIIAHHIRHHTAALRIVQSCHSAFLHSLSTFFGIGMFVEHSILVKV
jgi:hypothetical protein